MSEVLCENLMILVSFVLQGVSTFLLIFFGNIWLVHSSTFVFGIGYGGCVPQFPLPTRGSFGMRSYGLVYGEMSSGLGFGALIGSPVLGGILFSLTRNILVTFVPSGGFSLMAGVVSLSIRYPNWRYAQEERTDSTSQVLREDKQLTKAQNYQIL